MATKNGIDVSKWDGMIDWDQTAKAVDFVIIRAGYGKLVSQKDQYFERNYAECKKRGIPCGVYWYSYATSVGDAKLEAEACLSILKDKTFELPVYYDIEEKAALRLANQITPIFNGLIEAAGYASGIYASASAFKSYFNKSLYDNKKYSIWVANYTSSLNSRWGVNDYDLWQYSSSGTTPGINKRTDMDYLYTEFKDLDKKGTNKNTDEKKDENTFQDEFVKLDLSDSPELKAYALAMAGADISSMIDKEMSIDEFVRKADKNHYKVLVQLVSLARTASKLDSNASIEAVVVKMDTKGNISVKLNGIDVTYQVYTRNGWLHSVMNCEDYAGIENREIYGIAATVSKGTLKYRTHASGENWFDWVDHANINDWEYGVAGIKTKPIDGIQFDYSDKNYKVVYRVSIVGDDDYLPWVTNWGSGPDRYAGIYGKPIDKIQVKIEKV